MTPEEKLKARQLVMDLKAIQQIWLEEKADLFEIQKLKVLQSLEVFRKGLE